MIYQPVEILLVEDNPLDAEMAIHALKKGNIGNHLLHVNDGVEALDYLSGTGEFEGRDTSIIPKLILIDLKMPRVNGIEFLQQIKLNPVTKKIPVVVLTSSNQDIDILTCYDLGVNSYVVKPVDFEEFTATLSKLGTYWMNINQPPH